LPPLEIDVGQLLPRAIDYDKAASNSAINQGGGKRRLTNRAHAERTQGAALQTAKPSAHD
jgi:hypothetical protein